MGVINDEPDIVDSVVVDAIDHLCHLAPGVGEWWTGLVIPARKLREQYNYCLPFPDGYRSVRPYAYLPFFTPRYLPRLRHALRAGGLDLRALLKLTDGLVRILDLGAGTGIVTVACLLELERACQNIEINARVEVILRDNDKDSLELASRLLEFLQQASAWPHLQVKWECHRGDILSEIDAGLFDIVLLGHVVCESYQWQHKNADPALVNNLVSAFLERLLPAIECQLSHLGVVLIIEPLNRNHLSMPLHIRDYVRANSALTVLAPCLGRSLHCPERTAPYSRPAACSGSTYRIAWNPRTSAGHRLRLFTEAILDEDAKGVTLRLPIGPSYFFPLVLSLGERAPVPASVGMTVRRVGLSRDKRPVCVVGADGYERVEVFAEHGSRADRCILGAVNVQDQSLVDYDLSALYPNGWPMVL